MKKLLCVLCLLLALVCIFAACDTKETPNADSNNNDNMQNEQGGDETPEGGEETPEDGEETPTPAPHTHTWSAWETIIAATCGTAGQQKRVCACGESETQSIPATGSCVYNTQNICTVCGVALQYTEGLAYTLNSDGESYTVTKGTAMNNTTDIVIPWYHEGKPVTSIGYGAFSGCSGLTGITIPASVTSIGYEAFYRCRNLLNVTIPTSVTSIGLSAFGACTNLIQKENGVYYVDKWAIDCDNATNAILRPNTIGIANAAFQACRSLTALTFPMNIKYIGNQAFSDCTGLVFLTIPDGVVEIGSSAFWGCYNLTSITVPASVESIGSEAFYNCCKLIEIYNLSSASIHGTYLTHYAKDIYTTKSSKSNLFTSTDGYIFYDNETNRYLMGYTGNSTELILPTDCNENAYMIYKYAFYSWNGTSVVIPTKVTHIYPHAFSFCQNLTTVEFEDNSQLLTIQDHAFYSCRALSNFKIPSSVNTICASAFENCRKLTSVIFEETTGWWVSTSFTATSGTSVDVSAPTNNDDLLKSTYKNYYWKRTVA